MTRLPADTRWSVLPIMGIVMTLGCSRTEKAGRDTSAAMRTETTAARQNTTTGASSLALDTRGIAQLAAKYTFHNKSGPKQAKKSVMTQQNPGVKLNGKPTMDIAAATPTGSRMDPEILALVTSNKQYSGLGIEKGENYIVRDKHGSTNPADWRVYVVSMKPFGILRLTAHSEPFSDGDPMEPRIVYWEFDSSGAVHPLYDMVAYAFCFDDPSCQPIGHCGYNNGQ